MITTVVLDIEGTVSPIKSVRRLFVYTRQHLKDWLIAKAPVKGGSGY